MLGVGPKCILKSNSGTIVGAAIIAFVQGGASEHTFLTPIPADWIYAFKRIHGPKWQQDQWMSFDATTVSSYRASCQKYGIEP